MKTHRSAWSVALALVALVALVAAGSAQASRKAHDLNAALGRGINLGNLLDAPYEGAWGVQMKPEDFSRLASRGFQSVRIPIRWDGRGDSADHGFDRALRTPPYTVEERFFRRVDSAVAWARRSRLPLVLNDHHHDSLFAHYEREVPRFLAIWKQVAERYKDLPEDSVAFEVLNEPVGQVTPERWNVLLDTALKVIRKSNPTRPVLIGTANWGGPDQLGNLVLPADTSLILSVHDYEPKAFVYQGASWISPRLPTGVAWGSYWDRRDARLKVEAIARFAAEHDLPVNIGEFGTTYGSDSLSRRLWTETMCRLYETHGFSWHLWSFKDLEMGVYSEATGAWKEATLAALFSDDTTVLKSLVPPVPSGDILRNGGFADTSAWFLVELEGGKGRFSIDSGVGRIRVDSVPSGNSWSVEICQKPLTLMPGWSYRLQFDAWADTATSIDTWIGHGEDPWDSYGYSPAMALGTAPRRFEMAMRMPDGGEPDTLGEVCINMGTHAASIRIDSVRLLAYSPEATGLADAPTSRRERIRQEKGRLFATGSVRPRAAWLVDVRGVKVAPLLWIRTGEGWSAALSEAPRGKVLLVPGSSLRVLRE